MSGRRSKAIREAFIAAHNRAPDSVPVRHWGHWSEPFENAKGRLVHKWLGLGEAGTVSEWRRLKKAHARKRSGRGGTVEVAA